MRSPLRGWILPIIVLAILLATLPGAIHRLIQTGNPYLFSQEFFEDMVARLSGPGRFRFILQPVVAIFLGSRDGVKDARKHAHPFLWGLIFHREHRPQLLRSALESVRNLVAIAILLDIISQYLIFRQIHPGAALILGPVLISVPYTTARALANRIARRGGQGPAASPAS
ncbi:hypothetical protein [Acidobacterium sp. S8]|uniref:hypothetical protein n=1 Tax=Acidobacterium sp. S8 TaxID=1641854 RepID=UPI00131E2D05|nr:hypothetical protein [Acidobacterium sp. S8]